MSHTDHEKDLRRLAEFRMMDDDFMSAVFDSKPAETKLLFAARLPSGRGFTAA